MVKSNGFGKDCNFIGKNNIHILGRISKRFFIYFLFMFILLLLLLFFLSEREKMGISLRGFFCQNSFFLSSTSKASLNAYFYVFFMHHQRRGLCNMNLDLSCINRRCLFIIIILFFFIKC
jgi:hypothetical protein